MKTLPSIIAIIVMLYLFIQAQADAQGSSLIFLTRTPPIDIIAVKKDTDRIYIVKLYVEAPVYKPLPVYLWIGEQMPAYGSGYTAGLAYLWFRVYSRQDLEDLFNGSIRMRYNNVDYDLETNFPSEYIDNRTIDELPGEIDALSDSPYGNWYGYPIGEDFWVDTSGFIGAVHVRYDPWSYSHKMMNWIYMTENSNGWMWVSRK